MAGVELSLTRPPDFCFINTWTTSPFNHWVLMYFIALPKKTIKRIGVCFSSVWCYCSSMVSGCCSVVTKHSWQSLLAVMTVSSCHQERTCSLLFTGERFWLGWKPVLRVPLPRCGGVSPCHTGEWHGTSGKAVSSTCAAPVSPSSPCSGSDQ